MSAWSVNIVHISAGSIGIIQTVVGNKCSSDVARGLAEVSVAHSGRHRFTFTRLWCVFEGDLPRSGAPLTCTSGRIEGQG